PLPGRAGCCRDRTCTTSPVSSSGEATPAMPLTAAHTCTGGMRSVESAISATIGSGLSKHFICDINRAERREAPTTAKKTLHLLSYHGTAFRLARLYSF